jgi:hypothetical protein
MNTLGAGHQVVNGNRVADDFTVPASGWMIDTVTFFAYQTNSTTTSTFTAVNLRIWDGPPGGGGTVVWGDTTTNILDTTSFAGIFRVSETTLGANNRPIMANIVNVNTSLPAGQYWLDWQTDGTLASGPWAPPVTINGQTTTGDALQSLDSGVTYATLTDSLTLTAQGLPFIIEGGVPCTINAMAIAGNQLTIAGDCPGGVDIYYQQNGGPLVLVASSVPVVGSTTINIDPVAPDAIYIATLPGDTVPLAQAGPTVPTLGQWGLIAFVALLMLSGIFFLKRRRSGSVSA